MIRVYNKEKIISFLREEDEIANLNIIGAIENITKGLFDDPEDDLMIYVDDEENPNGVIVNEHSYWYYVYAKNDAFIYHIRDHFFNKLEEYGFDAVDHRVFEILSENKTIEWEEPCTLLSVDKEIFKPYKSKLLLTDGTVADSKIIDEHYTFKDEFSHTFIYDDLENRPSSIYRVDGEPVAWVLLHRDNSVGIMYTKKAYRGQGIAYDLSMDIISKVIEKDQIPYIHINVGNHASFSLAEKCGFKRYKEVFWFGIHKK